MRAYILLVLITGCGGEPFGTAARDSAVEAADAALGSADVEASAGATSVGGAPSAGGADGIGGATSAGGHLESKGGATSSGGTRGLGGAPPAAGGAPSVDGGTEACAPVTHSTGLGQMWQDCVPLGTYNQSQATKACKAWCAVNGGCSCRVGGVCPDSVDRAYTFTAGNLALVAWAWQGLSAGDTTQLGLGAPNKPAGCNTIGAWK